jgi:drug/metabolite transporter (DMT)-like permease
VTGVASSAGATTAGIGAIALWAGLAALAKLAGALPPFQKTALTFAIGSLAGLFYARLKGTPLSLVAAMPRAALALGVYGLLGFHVVYFLALARAPVLEASLIVYLWPLLIVLFSALLPKAAGGSSLSPHHVGGAALGFAGAGFLLLAGGDCTLTFTGGLAGYATAFAAAIIWASYSVASRLFADVPSGALVAASAITAASAAALHLVFETWVAPQGLAAWLAIAALGIGPTGLAFYLWDEGMKHGDLRLLGVAAYATPLLSTLVLAGAGLAAPGRTAWIAAALIAAGAFLARPARD